MEELSRELVGKRLRRIRMQQQLSRELFSEQVGISSQFLAELENGKKGMSTDTLYKICNRFSISADYLLFGKTNSSQLSDSIQTKLNAFPEKYIELTEEIISAIEKVTLTEKESKH